MPDLGSGLLGCYRCGYVWRLRKSPVRICPRCKSKFWDRPKETEPTRARSSQEGDLANLVRSKRTALLRLASQFGATDLRIFGSVARGEASLGSDVDLLVQFKRPIGVLARLEFKERASRLLGRPVDISTPETLHWLIRPTVVSEAVAL
jgi:predicted nucleotidyltransferase